MGAGIDMAPGDIAFKCNFATVDTNTNIVVKRRADRHFEDVGPVLCDALDGKSRFQEKIKSACCTQPITFAPHLRIVKTWATCV